MEGMRFPESGREAYCLTVEQVLSNGSTNGMDGLTEAEAAKRLESAGSNELDVEPPVPGWRKFFAQFQDTLVVLLLMATLISAGLWLFERESALPYEAIAILAVVILNAVMGYVQESRAESAVAALRSMSAARANVVRGGQRGNIPATEVVPGDIILIEEGDNIPADARLIESTALQTMEAALTGESVPVSKEILPVPEGVVLGDRRNMIFSGTSASYGRGRAVVVATGMSTEMGRVAGMLGATPDEETPLQRELDRVGRMLGMIVVVIAVVMIATILFVGNVRGLSAFFDVLILGVALAVAAVPEGLPAVVTAVLALGVQRMAKCNAIVLHLSAVETLGSADIIASDKTGTLTRNEMTVRAIITGSGRTNVQGNGYVPEGDLSDEVGGAPSGRLTGEVRRALTVAASANNAALREVGGRWEIFGDPTEGALIVAAQKAGLAGETLAGRFPRCGEIPFSSERKRMSTIHRDAIRNRICIFTKGAPDILLGHCSREWIDGKAQALTEARRAAILRSNEILAGGAMRTLGLAERILPEGALAGEAGVEEENDLTFLGLVGMMDPPRAEAREAAARAPGGRNSSRHDYRRSSGHSLGDCEGTGICRRRESGDRCGVGGHVGRRIRGNRRQGFGLCTGQSRTQAAHCSGPAKRGRDGGNDRGWRE